MARIARVLLWAGGTFSRRLLRCILSVLLIVVASVAVAAAGLPDQLLRGDNSGPKALLAAGSVIGVAAFVANLVAGLVSTQIQRWSDRRLPAVQEFFRNHDLAELTGQAIGMILWAAARSAPVEDRGVVERLAKKAPRAWTRLSTSPESALSFAPLFEQNLKEFVREPSRPALSHETWREFIRDVAEQEPNWSTATETLVLESLSRRFAEALREALKHDFVSDGRAFAALQLDIATSLLQQVTSAVTGDGKAQEALSEIRQMASTLELGQLAAVEASDRHHREVQVRFTYAIGGIDRLLDMGRRILITVEASHDVLQSTHSEVVSVKEGLAALQAEFRTARLRPQVGADGRVLPGIGTLKDIDEVIDELRDALDRDAFVEALRDMTGSKAIAAIDQLIEKRKLTRDHVAKSEAKLWLQRGNLSFQANPSEALSAFQQAVELDSSDSAAWRGKAISLDKLGRPNEALEASLKALELSPNEGVCWSAHAHVLGSLGRHEDAIDAYEQALNLRPDDVVNWINKGFEFGIVGQVERAFEAFEKAISLDPLHAIVWTNMGWALGKKGMLDEEIKAHQKAVELDPLFAIAWGNLGSTLERIRQFDDSLASLEKSIELNPNNASVWVAKAAMLRRLNRLSEAEKAILKAIELNSEEATSWDEKSLILVAQNRLHDAVLAGEKGVALDPNNAVAWFNLGTTFKKLHRYEDAAEAFAKSVSCDDSDADAWYRLGHILGLLGRFDEAIEKLKRATELAPNLGEAWADIGRALATLGRMDEAIDALDRAATLSGDASVWRDKGNVLAQLRRFGDALEALGEAAKLDQTDTRIFLSAGEIFIVMGRFEDAVEALKMVVQLSPDDRFAWERLGMVFGITGADSDALNAYDKALALVPDSAAAWNGRGCALASLGQLEKALVSFDRAIAIEPTFGGAWQNKIRALKELGRHDEAGEAARHQPSESDDGNQ